MAYLKRSDIKMVGEAGEWQLTIGNHCVTRDYKTKEACYEAYIVELINSIEKTRDSLTNNTGF